MGTKRSITINIQYTYLLHVLVEPQQITIEIEDKYSGDLWLTVHTSSGI